MSKSTDKQPENSGPKGNGRDEKGRFTKGNPNEFKPGESGNPKGRPKSITLSEAFRAQLSKPLPGDPLGRTFAEVVALNVCIKAAKGDVVAAREIADRTEGKPKQTVDVDMSLFDWRALAQAHGISEQDVIAEAKRIIAAESATHSSH